MTVRLSGLSSFYLFQNSMAIRNRDLFRASEQLSSQKRINRPSDDPEGSKTVLTYRSAMEKIDQYKKNILASNQYLVHTEAALTSMKGVLDRVKELSIQGNNTALGQDVRETIADELQQKAQELLGLVNTEVNGEYLFSGFATNIRPFTLDAGYPTPATVTFNGDTNLKATQIGEGQTLTVQIRGDYLVQGDGTAGTVDLFAVLGAFENTMRTEINPAATAGDPDHIDTITAAMGDVIEDLDTAVNQVLRQITSIGGKVGRLRDTENNFDIQLETFKTFISDIEDKDIAEISMEFQKAQLALQATLSSAGATLNLPTLMDFVGR